MRTSTFNFRQFNISVLLFLTLLAISCSAKKFAKDVKRIEYEIASKTTRSDIVNQTVIALHGFNFTIEYANIHKLHSALKTDWRMHSRNVSDYDILESLQMRDRALIHLSARGFQGRTESMVASKIEFEVQIQFDSNWTSIYPDSTFIAEYLEIVDAIKTRIQHKGYKFIK